MCTRGKVNGTSVLLCLSHHTHVCCFSVSNWLEKIFGIRKVGSTTRREVIAGLTTFVTMSYIVAVNPAILKSAGIPAGPSMAATIATTVFGTLWVGLYANRPFAIAPYMGENAFIAFTVVRALGYSWQAALASVFLAGILFLLLTVLKLRQWLVGAIPNALRHSFAVGIGLFLTFVGLNETGIVHATNGGAPLQAGNLTSGPVLLAIVGFLVMAILMIRRFPAAILVGILVTPVVAFVTGIAPHATKWMSDSCDECNCGCHKN